MRPRHAALESHPVSDPFAADPIVVEVVRNGLVESVHHARVAVTGPGGDLIGSIGAVDAVMYPRSALKPLQVVAMVGDGLDLPDDLLALVAASHSGEQIHLDGARRILDSAGLTEDALQTPPDWPADEQAKIDQIRAGADTSRIFMNCSGKHAGMLATAVLNGWGLADYRDPAHPVQLAARDTIAELSGETPTQIAVDGCGAPAFVISLIALARSFGRLATATDGPERRGAGALPAPPPMEAGATRGGDDPHLALPRPVPKGRPGGGPGGGAAGGGG